MWEASGLIDTFEYSLDAFVSAGDDGLRAASTCAGMGDFSLHCIDLSLGSGAARTRPKQLEEARRVIEVMGARSVSDHLAYGRVDDRRLHDFAPLWRVEEQLDLFVENVEWVRERLGVQLAVENVASLFDPGGEMTGAEFANEVLLDISNVLINEINGFCDAAAEFMALDLDGVVQVHLAGGELVDGLMWDAHSSPVPRGDVEWLERLLPMMPNCTSVVIERDEHLERGQELVDDLRAVHGVVSRVEASPVPV
jgi:uncharacterized protein (UPF0276 family)